VSWRRVAPDHHLLESRRIHDRSRDRITALFTNANRLRRQFFRGRPRQLLARHEACGICLTASCNDEQTRSEL